MLLIAKAENDMRILGFPSRPSSINHFLLKIEQNRSLNWCKYFHWRIKKVKINYRCY